MFVIYYHNVLPAEPEGLERASPRLSVEAFRKQVQWICRHFQPLGMGEFLECLESGSHPRRGILFTFDDGYEGVREHALPVLAEAGCAACVFTVSDPRSTLHFEAMEIALCLTQRRQFKEFDLSTEAGRLDACLRIKKWLKTLPDDQRRERQAAIVEQLGVSSDAIQAHAEKYPGLFRKLPAEELRALETEGWWIGAHTRSHPMLTRTDDATLADELTPPDFLTGAPSNTVFAYPYGGCDARVVEAVRAAGYRAAFSTENHPVRKQQNPFTIPRLSFGELWKRAMRHAGRA